MFRLNLKCLLIVAVVAATLMTTATQANAFWGWHRAAYWGGYRPYYTAYYSPYYTSHYSYYSPSYTTCCYPTCWSNCCVSTCCDPCCDPCCDGATATTSTGKPTPAPQKEPATGTDPTPEPPPIEMDPTLQQPPTFTPPPGGAGTLEEGGTTSTPTRANSGLLVVHVPYDAKVTINGIETRSKGSRRTYVSHGLDSSLDYKYTIRAEVVREGQAVWDEKSVVLTAGDREAIAFGFNLGPAGGLASR